MKWRGAIVCILILLPTVFHYNQPSLLSSVINFTYCLSFPSKAESLSFPKENFNYPPYLLLSLSSAPCSNFLLPWQTYRCIWHPCCLSASCSLSLSTPYSPSRSIISHHPPPPQSPPRSPSSTDSLPLSLSPSLFLTHAYIHTYTLSLFIYISKHLSLSLFLLLRSHYISCHVIYRRHGVCICLKKTKTNPLTSSPTPPQAPPSYLRHYSHSWHTFSSYSFGLDSFGYRTRPKRPVAMFRYTLCRCIHVR